MLEYEEVLAFIDQQDEGASWGDIEKHFVGDKKWSKGKFVNHWKKAKKFLEIVPDPETGYSRYIIKETSKVIVEKATLKNDIDINDLHEISIDQNRLSLISDQIAESYQSFFFAETVKAIGNAISVRQETEQGLSGSLFSRLKRKILKTEDIPKVYMKEVLGASAAVSQLLTVRTELFIGELAKKVQIKLVSPENETPPVLTDDDLQKIFDIVFSKIFDKNHKRIRGKPFHLIVGFPLEKPELDMRAVDDVVSRFIEQVKKGMMQNDRDLVSFIQEQMSEKEMVEDEGELS